MRSTTLIFTLSVLFLLLGPGNLTAQKTAKGSFQWLGKGFEPNAVSPDGRVVVGGYFDGVSRQAFRWDPKTGPTLLPNLNDAFPYSEAMGVSNDGTVIVGFSVKDTIMVDGVQADLFRAVRWVSGGVTELPSLGYPVSMASGVSADGNVIIGNIDSAFISTEGWNQQHYYNVRVRASKWTGGAASFLPGIDLGLESHAYGVSPDGSVIVGSMETRALRAQVATKWTPAGMASLGIAYPPYSMGMCASMNGEYVGAEKYTPDPSYSYRISSTGGVRMTVGDSCEVHAISADGGRMIGTSSKSYPYPPPHGFVWDAATGTQRDLASYCKTVLGITLNNTSLSEARAMSADGNVIVGCGWDSLNHYSGFRIQTGSTSISVWYPRTGSFWQAGTTDTIRWTCFTHYDSVAIFFSPDSGATEQLIVPSIAGDSGSVAFRMPDNVMSTKCLIIIRPYGDTARGSSGMFKSKGVYLTRLAPNGQYEKFERLLHAYTFGNEESFMWPQTWWQRFNYQAGIDPNTGWAYPPDHPWDTMKASDFTDWPTFVRAFDVGACYFSVTPPVYKREALEKWSQASFEWYGSCAGIASTSLMAFDNLSRFRANYPAMGAFSSVSELSCTDDVRGVINEIYAYQFGVDDETWTAARQTTMSPVTTMREIRKMLLSESQDDQYLAIFNNGVGGGGHAIVPYRLDYDSTSPNGYWISVYDNSFTDDYSARIRVDTTANGGDGSWSYSNFPTWGGAKKLFLDQPVSNYFHQPVLGSMARSLRKNASVHALQAPGRYGAFAHVSRNIIIADAAGNRVGFHGDSILVEIPDAYPIIAKTGREGPPVGYSLPPGGYTVKMDQFGGSNSSFTLFSDAGVSKYSRADAAAGQTDLLSVLPGGGFTVTNNDTSRKSIDLEIIAKEDALEKVYRINALSLRQSDSIVITPVGNDRIALSHSGPAAGTFDLSVEQVSRDGEFRFTRKAIALPGNTGCQISPDWNNFTTDSTLKILIDHGNKGSFDDSTVVNNQTVNVVTPMPGSTLTVNDTSWMTDGSVYGMATSGNILYLGGDFTAVGPATGHAAALDLATGSPDLKFPKINGSVSALVSDGAGGWFIGGAFTRVGSVTRRNCVHINADRSVDVNWNPAPNRTVNSFVLSGSVLYAGGSFDSIDNGAKRYLVALDAVTGHATDWNPAVNGNVNALAVSGATVYVGGNFDSAGGKLRRHAAAIDAMAGGANDWNPAPDNPVFAIVPVEGRVYVGGAFLSIGGESNNGLGVLDTTLGVISAWHHSGVAGVVRTICVSGATVFIGGTFHRAGVGDSVRNYIAALDTGTGKATPWNPNAGGDIYALAVTDTVIYAGGSFSTMGTVAHNSLAAIDRATGLPTDWTANTEAGKVASVLLISGTELYAGGNFLMAGGAIRNNAAALDIRTNRITAWNPNPNSSVGHIVPVGANVYICGSFTRIGGQLRYSLGQVDSMYGNATAWNPGVDATVGALAADGKKLYISGSFGHAGGQVRRNAAAFDLATGALTAWVPNPDDAIYAFAVADGIVYAGGGFNSIGGLTRHYIAAVDTTLGAAIDWNPVADKQVFALCVEGDKIFAGGRFSIMGGKLHNNAAAIDKISGNVSTWAPAPNNSVYGIAVSASAVYLGGTFTAVNGLPRTGLAAVDRISGLPTTWSPALVGSVNALSASSPFLFAGGTFSDIDSTQHANFARFTDAGLIQGVKNSPTGPGVPRAYSLEQNYPNPFNPMTNFGFRIADIGFVRLAVYNLLGQKVAVLVNEQKAPGEYHVQWNASGAASGVYFYRLDATSAANPSKHFSQTKKMILVK